MNARDVRSTLHEIDLQVEDKRPERSYFVVTCKTCKARWSLGIRAEKVGRGNVLALFDHAAAHQEERLSRGAR